MVRLQQQSLCTLNRAITMSQNQFALILVRCNYSSLRQEILTKIVETSSLPFSEVWLTEFIPDLYINLQLASQQNPSAVMVMGLETIGAKSVGVSDINPLASLLRTINQQRDRLRYNFSFPIVLWLNDEVLLQLIQSAPDFYSWAAPVIEFAVTPMALTELIEQSTARVFEIIFNAKINSAIQDVLIEQEISFSTRLELELACQELKRHNQGMPITLQADLDFILGRDDYYHHRLETARHHYKRSLSIYQQEDHRLKQGVLLFYLGLSWLQPSSQPDWLRAKQYLETCLEIFSKSDRPDLVAKFINSLSGVLLHLKLWEDLESLAYRALHLHQGFCDPANLAQDYGFLAQVNLARCHWLAAQSYAGLALSYLDTATTKIEMKPSLQKWYQICRGQYQFWLAQAEYALGEVITAKAHLHDALVELDERNNPQLYISILETLRAIDFSQGNYLKAFQTKQRQRTIEQQYCLRAFIGAGRLQAKRQLVNEVISSARSGDREIAAIEIIASGRCLDVDRLIERIEQGDRKLTIIHGESGVGKSSIVNAGLVPALAERSINGREARSVVLRVYTDWLAAIWQQLSDRFKLGSSETTASNSNSLLERIIKQLQRNSTHNLITVLIFDQFEEFFFTWERPSQRQQFFQFLRICWQIPFVKVILSMREDYLHLLLEAESAFAEVESSLTDSLDLNQAELYDLPESIDILSRHFRYPLGNLSLSEARSVIESLTQQSQFPLESALIDVLVRDLAAELGYVRPIELQVVGAQLQAENITTLSQYRQVGPKQKLVERSLAGVIKDCGVNAEIAARRVLLALTDEQGTRPLKTYTDLVAELGSNADQLSLVLEILVGSGLLFLLPDTPTDRYQLVHDYLVPLIRQQEQTGLLEELARMRESAARSEALIDRLYKGALAGTIVASVIMGGLAWQARSQKYLAEAREIRALSSSSEALLSSHKSLEALIAAVKAGKKLQQIDHNLLANDTARSQTFKALQAVVYNIKEQNLLRIPNERAPIFAAEFSPDGKTIATAKWSNSVDLWSVNGQLIRSFPVPDQIVRDVSFSPDGKQLAAAVEDGTLRIWYLQTGEVKIISAHRKVVNALSFSPDGKVLASASANGSIKLWDNSQLLSQSRERQDSAVLLRTFSNQGSSIFDLTFSPDGKMLATASSDHTIKIWDLQGKLLQVLQGHTQAALHVRFSLDGQLLASTSADKTIRLWRISGGNQFTPWRIFNSLDSEIQQAIAFSPDSTKLAAASRDRSVKVLDLEGNIQQTFSGHESIVFDVNFSPDGETLVSASKDGSVRIWRNNSTLVNTLRGHADMVWAIAFSPDGNLLASASVDQTVKLWHKSGELLRTFNGHTGTVNSLNFSPKDNIIASAGQDRTLKIWNLQGDLLKTLRGHSDRVNSISFSPDGTIIASASSDQTVKLWHWQKESSSPITLVGHSDVVTGVSFSPDGKTLASAGEDSTLKLWNLDGQLLNSIKAHDRGILAVSFSPAHSGNQAVIATASKDKTLKLWSQDGLLLQTITENDWIYGLSFSADGKIIAAASADRTVKLWHWQDRTLLKTLSGHEAEVNAVSFSPTEPMLVSASRDGTIKLWNSETLDLDNLLSRGCAWLHDYLQYSSDLILEDRQTCDFK